MMNSHQYSGIAQTATAVGASPSEGLNAMSSMMNVYKAAKEKWDANGGNEVLGRVSASIPDSTKAMMNGFFKREHIRTITVYFGIGEERAFYIEKNPALLIDRLKHNISFFYLNYILITCTLFCLTLLTSPTTIIGLALLAGCWFWLIRSSSTDGFVRISNVAIPQKTAVIGMAILSAFALFYLLSNVFWWTLFSSGFLTLLHSVFRDASMHKDMDDVVKMEGDLHFNQSSTSNVITTNLPSSPSENSSFLNSRV